jgi:hypothetical protein
LRPVKQIALLALLGGCLVAAGCGSDEEGAPIPADSATVLQGELNSVADRIANGSVGACRDVSDSATSPNTKPIQDAIDGLPGDVDQDVRDALQQGFDRLFELVDERCAELEDETDTQTETEPTPTETTDTETETTETTDTETTPTDTTTIPTDTTDETSPPTDTDVPPSGDGSGGDQGGGILAPQGDEG